MITVENIFNTNELNVHYRANESYLKQDSFIKLLKRCNKNKIAIIGIEGFELNGDTITPLTDLIADYSCIDADTWEEYITICNSSAKSLFDQILKEKNRLFNFTFLSEDEWLGSVAKKC